MRHWIAESFGHCKAIGATGEAVNLVADALGETVSRIQLADATGGGAVESYGVVTTSKLHEPEGLREGVKIVKGAADFLGKFFYQISQHRNYARELDGLTAGIPF
jgi:catalase